jgi:hypothetical protein
MRIISKEKDYYDHMLSYGINPKLSMFDDYRNITFCKNPSYLSRFMLDKIVSPEEIFNQISTYISNMNMKELATISNDSKIIKAGFDLITSYRH